MLQVNIVRVGVDKRHIVRDGENAQAEFQELAQIYRERVKQYNYSYQWFERVFPRWGRQSPKMCCWIARECFDEMFQHYQENQMTANGKSKNPQDTNVKDWGFVNVQLSDEEREAAQLDYADSAALWENVVLALKDGYKVTLSFDVDTESYCAALSGTNCGKPNERLTLTAWGDSETDALAYVIYKHVTKLEFIWQKPGAKPKRLG